MHICDSSKGYFYQSIFRIEGAVKLRGGNNDIYRYIFDVNYALKKLVYSKKEYWLNKYIVICSKENILKTNIMGKSRK